jgi:hypothetical protein
VKKEIIENLIFYIFVIVACITIGSFIQTKEKQERWTNLIINGCAGSGKCYVVEWLSDDMLIQSKICDTMEEAKEFMEVLK